MDDRPSDSMPGHVRIINRTGRKADPEPLPFETKGGIPTREASRLLNITRGLLLSRIRDRKIPAWTRPFCRYIFVCEKFVNFVLTNGRNGYCSYVYTQQCTRCGNH